MRRSTKSAWVVLRKASPCKFLKIHQEHPAKIHHDRRLSRTNRFDKSGLDAIRVGQAIDSGASRGNPVGFKSPLPHHHLTAKRRTIWVGSVWRESRTTASGRVSGLCNACATSSSDRLSSTAQLRNYVQPRRRIKKSSPMPRTPTLLQVNKRDGTIRIISEQIDRRLTELGRQ
jgi:hypothetical protein